MKKLRGAVVGVGYLGRFHAQKYKALSDLVDFVGVCDASAARAEEVAKELGVSFFTDSKLLVGQVDVVTIASATKSHYELAKFFLENDIHVHVEKPMTETVAEAEELVALAEKRKLKLQVGHVERFNPALISVREKLRIPHFIECHRLAPFKPRGVDVDVVLDLMIHDLDLILSLVNSPVRSVSAVGTPVLTSTVDIANARIEFESGTIANVTASRVSQSATRKFRIFQPAQYLSIDFGSGEVNLTEKVGQWVIDSSQNVDLSQLPLEFHSWSLEKGDALLNETKSFLESVALDRPCVVSGRDGLNALSLAETIRSKIRERFA